MRASNLVVAVLAVGASSCSQCNGNGSTIPGSFGSAPVKAPSYTPLSAPQASIPLPAFFVGSQGVLDGGCLQGDTPVDVAGVDELEWTFEQEKEFKSKVQASFEKFLIEAGLSAELAKTQVEQWSISASGLSYRQVSASTVRPNFTDTCNQQALGWFVDERRVVLWGVKAEEVTIKVSSALAQTAQAAIEAAMEKINTEFSANFSASTNAQQELQLTATNSFIGVLEATLVSQECTFSVPAGDSVAVCGNQFTVQVTPSAIANRITVSVTPANGSTNSFDEEVDKQAPRQVGSNHVMFAMPKRSGGKLRVDGKVWLVGVSGME